MAVSTSDGRYYEDEHDYHHERLFGPQQEDAGGEGKMYMVRHGDTNCNDDGEVHGWVNEPLNEKGIEQAHKAAESLKDKDITRIVSSDLPRAKQTANILAKQLGVEVQFDPRLRTWDAGDFDYTDKHKEFEKYTRTADMFDKIFPRVPPAAPIPEQIPPSRNNRGYRQWPEKLQPRDHFDYIQEPGESYEDFNNRLTPEERKHLEDYWYEYAPAEGGGMGWKTRSPKIS